MPPAAAPSDSPVYSLVDEVQQSPPVDVTAPYSTDDLAGKTVLITGGASGFGAAFSRRWAGLGANIIIGDISDAAGEALVAELRGLPGSSGHHYYQHCDVTVWEDQVALFDFAVRSSPTGGIDAVVPSAGIMERRVVTTGRGFENPINVGTEESPSIRKPGLETVGINLTGVMYTVHLALFWLARNDGSASKSSATTPSSSPSTLSSEQQQQPRRDRHILLLGSVASLTPLPGMIEYGISKHAVLGVFRSLRGTARARQGVRVNMLLPYFVDTPMMPASGMMLLAGVGIAQVEDVVDAGTRLMADRGVVGRALVVGPKLRSAAAAADDGGLPVVVSDKKAPEQAVWECYAEDFEHVDAFLWRWVMLINRIGTIERWVGFIMGVLNVLLFRKADKPRRRK